MQYVDVPLASGSDPEGPRRAVIKVSCLCVTRGKPEKLRRAIDCFFAQTHPNKELVIVYETDDPATAAVVSEYAGDERIQIHAIGVSPKRTLGELRNLSIDVSRGEYFCQWDDDDWYAVNRIEAQLRAVIDGQQDATVLTNWFMFDAGRRQAYFSHFRLWEGSLLCRRAAVAGKLQYPPLRRMEDSFFMNDLISSCRVLPMVAPELYIYEVHQNNTWGARHFQLLLAHAQPLSPDLSRLFEEVLAGRYPAAEASIALRSPGVLRELKYLYVNTFTPPNERLEHYRQTMERLRAPASTTAPSSRAPDRGSISHTEERTT